MHDPKFEKEVQQKMAELEFSPSESVWANVEKAVNKRRNRRALPFFWRLALPGLLLLAGGGYYLFRETPAPVATSAPAATTPGTAATAPAPGRAAASTSAPAGATATPKISPVHPAPLSGSDENTSISSTLTATGTGTSGTHSRNPFAASAKHHGYREKTPSTDKPGSAEQVTAVAITRSTGASGARIHGPGSSRSLEPTHGSNQTRESNQTRDPGPTPEPHQGRTPYYYTPDLASLNKNASAIGAGKLPGHNTAATVKVLQSPRHPWEAAFTGGAGISSLHQVQLSNITLASNDITRANTTSYVTASAATPSKQYVSAAQPGASFWAGVLAQKQLSARWGLSLGLDLHYYSTRVRIGQQVNYYTPASTTLLTSSAGVAPVQSYPYYNAGDNQSYTNRYYFLELPVAVEWKINRSHLLPIFWDGGFSVSYLMGSSAVYYNTHSGVYFKDGGVANRTQFNLSTALMVGLPVRGLRIQLGPQIQYGLTPLLNTGQSGEQHIFYGGIRVVVFPGKK